MSPNTANSLVHDLVEMAKAMDILPQVEAERDSLLAMNIDQARVISSREEAILRYKAEIETLNAKVRTAEAERDDAEIRFLEADDRMLKLERTFQKSLEAADEVDKLIQSFKPVPPQPEPVVEVQPSIPEVVQSIEPNPYPHAGHGYDEPQGQSEVNPTSTEHSQTGYSTDTLGVAEPTPGPYTNKLYHNHPVYVHPHDWIEGGGTEESYRWRPDVGSSA